MARPLHTAIYPGSFDPMTFGHLDVIRRGRRVFDSLVVAVGQNPGKEHLFTLEERVEMARRLIDEIVREEPGEAGVSVRSYTGLTVDVAREVGANVILRGIRNLSDLQNEVQQALTNREVAGLETAFIVAGQSFAYTSSSLIKQITAMARDPAALRSMCPPMVVDALLVKRAQRPPLLARMVDPE
jgi:pantetheine-phosphate adenylyltransferase